jgi:hypothetical protein
MYYVVHSLSNLSIVAIHFETHVHLVSEGKYRESLEEMKSMVAEEVLCMPNATSSTISLAMSKTLLSCHLFNEDGEVPMELHSSHVNVCSFVFSYIHNLILSIKHRPWAPLIPSSCSSP